MRSRKYAPLFYGDEEDLIMKTEKVINDEDFRKKLVNNGYEREKLFGWDKCASETLSFYKEILNGNKQ